METSKGIQTRAGAGVDMMHVRADRKAFPRICDTPAKEANERMAKVIIWATMLRGGQPDVDSVRFMAEAVVAQCMDGEGGVRFLAWPEVERAVRKAVMGEGSEMYGVNAASVYKALYEYAVGEARRNQQVLDLRRRERRIAADKAERKRFDDMVKTYTTEFINNQSK